MEQRRVVRHPITYYLRISWIIDFIKGTYTYKLKRELFEWKIGILMHIPGRIGSFVRKRALGFKTVGRNVIIADHTYFRAPQNISIGDDVRIHPMTYLDASGGIEIGSHIGITSGVQIYSQNHGTARDQLYYYQPVKLAKVTIEDDSWIGSGSLIMAGVTIREGTVVAAGSVVTKDTEPYSIVGGVPAKKIGERK